MIKEALKYLVELGAPTITTINGEAYSDRSLQRIDYRPLADSIQMVTLTSLVDYIKSKADSMSDKMFVHIISPTKVLLYSQLNYDRNRETIAEVRAMVPDFSFGSFLDHESFCIGLQSKFMDNDDRALLLKFAGTVEAGTVAEYGDDGISQKATVKTGIASKSDAIVPNPVALRPYRTFMEVEQPESQFIFRMQQGRSGEVVCAIFESDGGAWKMNAMKYIKAYLDYELSEYQNFIVIA